MYIHREIETTIQEMLKQFKVVLVTGARQVGKTTVLENCLKDSFSYVTLENPIEASNAENDSLLFFDIHNLPLIIDEASECRHCFRQQSSSSTSQTTAVRWFSLDRRRTTS